jgi:hypothetical protein
MFQFIYGFLARSAVMLPVIVVFSAGIWLLLNRLGVMRSNEPFNAADLRTWPLSYALADAVLFASLFAAINAALGDSELSVATAAGAAAAIALGPVPALLARKQK